MSGNCSTHGVGGGFYDYNHNPWIYYNDSADAAECAMFDVPAGTPSGGALAADVQSGSLPNIGLLKPSLLNDSTQGTLAQADSWLASWIPAIQAGSDWQAGRWRLSSPSTRATTLPVARTSRS